MTAPVAVDTSVKSKPVEHKDKKKTHKSRKSDCSVDKDSKTNSNLTFIALNLH